LITISLLFSSNRSWNRELDSAKEPRHVHFDMSDAEMPDMMEQDEEYDLQIALALSMQVRMQKLRTYDYVDDVCLLTYTAAARLHAAAVHVNQADQHCTLITLQPIH
jgi:hypothetical protein